MARNTRQESNKLGVRSWEMALYRMFTRLLISELRMSRRKKETSIFTRLAWLVVLAAVALVIVLVGISNIMAKHEAYREGVRLQAEKEAERDAIKLKTKELQAREFKFMNDASFLEEVAHEAGMVQPGEFLVEFQGDPAPRFRP